MDIEEIIINTNNKIKPISKNANLLLKYDALDLMQTGVNHYDMYLHDAMDFYKEYDITSDRVQYAAYCKLKNLYNILERNKQVE